MSEVNLAALAESAADNVEAKASTPMQEINSALKECGFGWFHLRVLCASYFGFSAGILITNTVPYILPNAECDLDMDLLHKGILTATPYVGMICSSAVAGFLTDTFGRKRFLVGGYALMAIFNVLSSLSQNYNVLLASKFCEGIVFAVAFNPTMTLTSEFCYSGIRDRVMLLQSSFASTSQIILAGLSWAILMKDWRVTFFDGYIVLNTWNFYLLLMTLFPMTSCFFYCLLPESPKYLLAQKRYDEARETLIYIYKCNTGKPADTFKYVNIWKDKNIKSIDETPETGKSTLVQQLTAGLHNVKPMFQKPYVQYLIQFCSIYFLVMMLYNIIRMWFPQLSTIVEHYSTPENQELCTMLDAYTRDQKLRSMNTTAEVCIPTKSGTETYINSIILGFVCLPPYMLSGLLVNKVGKKWLLTGAGVLSIGATLGLRWASSKAWVVALFACDMAIAQIMMSLMQATTVEFFPTTIRTLAIAVSMTMGRTGSLVGNVVFPILLNMGCVVPFFTLTGFMICVTAMIVMLPKKKTM